MATQDESALLSSEETTAGDSQTQEQTDPNQGKSEEEIEFSKLSGSAQDRIRNLVRRAKEAEDRATRFESQVGRTQLPPPPPTVDNSDVQTAVKRLDEVGIATKDYVKQILEEQRRNEWYSNRLRALEETENGQDGRPRFDRYEYEDYVRQHPQYQAYDPGDVFGIMYRQELIDWEMKNRGGSPTTPSLRSSRTVQQADIWTPEYINEQIGKDPTFYEKNFEKINKVLGSIQSA